MENVKNIWNKTYLTFYKFIKWVLISVIVGLVAGGVGSFFAWGVLNITKLRTSYDFLIYLLPVAGIFVVLIYRVFNNLNDTGTNAILLAASGDKKVPLTLTVQIIVASFVSHICGASVGREGAALQIGGSIGSFLGRFFKLSAEDKTIIVLCGMSAAFAAVFGTPLCAAVFAMEVVWVGFMSYYALLPCACSALIASSVANYFGLHPETFPFYSSVPFNIVTGSKILLISVLCAGLSILFVLSLKYSGKYFAKFFKNRYIRICVGGSILLVLTLLTGSRDYNGAGMNIIMNALNGKVIAYAFILKLVFTAISIGCGFKGGEIVPSLFIGATFGCFMGNLLNISPGLCAAVGMLAVFCGSTNCPLAALLMGFELFGFHNVPFLFMAVSISFALSGNFSLYKEQRMMFDKLTGSIIKRKDI